MRSREWSNKLYDIAESQLGYFTASQARSAGVQQVRLVQLNQTGDVERVSRGVYRLVRFPLSPLGQYMEAALWPQVRRPGALAVISHVSALALHELSEVSPAKIHITLPPDLRVRRAVPRHLVLHFAPLASDDVRVVDGVPVTTPVRTIRDVHAAHLGPALVRRAIADGRRTGRLTH
ncbi:MAG TPA: type IV toxin-antitoxin system AbiEi family antitoxin domain-containing protein, partial [Gemmatimonadaceae bacterium]